MTRRPLYLTLLAGFALALPLSFVHGQDAQGESTAGDRQEQAQSRETPPTLDDLLGLTPEKREAEAPEKGEAAPDPSRRALDRRLTAQEVSEQFTQAVQLMGDTAERLQVSRDTGIETQRMQDEILRKLDMLIQMAEQQQQEDQQGGGSSSASGDPEEQPAQPQQQASQDQGEGGDPDSAQTLPPGQDPQLSPEVAARGASWGNLPERARDALLQGNADTYSRMYQRWTEAYYRRLAEEGNR